MAATHRRCRRWVRFCRDTQNRGQPLFLRYRKDGGHAEQSFGIRPCVIPKWPLGVVAAGAKLSGGLAKCGNDYTRTSRAIGPKSRQDAASAHGPGDVASK